MRGTIAAGLRKGAYEKTSRGSERDNVMKLVYKILAYLVAAEIAVQAMAVVFGDAGMFRWIGAGGVLDNSISVSDPPFPEFVGFVIHGINGMTVIPAIALLLLISSFFARVPRAVPAAGLVCLLVALQVTLGLLGKSIPALGAAHGLNALLLFSAAIHAARRARRRSADESVTADAPLAARG